MCIRSAPGHTCSTGLHGTQRACALRQNAPPLKETAESFHGPTPMARWTRWKARFRVSHTGVHKKYYHGQAQLEVPFDSDANGILNITAGEKSTKRTNTVPLRYYAGKLDRSLNEHHLRKH
jgi:hypothetical protein